MLRPGGRAVIGQIPLRSRSQEYDAAKERYFSRYGVSTTERNPLREDCRMPIVLFSEENWRGSADGSANGVWSRVQPPLAAG